MNFDPQSSASGLASLGRGEDSMLVHMTPGEVGSLQQLAAANGGSLTMNPETGLPEAGFLSDILPVIAGVGAAALAPMTGGGSLAAFLGNPLAVGLTTGALTGLVTGDLGKGVSAGLGAYGGAGLGNLFSGVGGKAAIGAAPKLAVSDAPLTGVNQFLHADIAARAGTTAAAAPITSGLAAATPAKATGLSALMNKEGMKYLGAAASPFLMGALKPTKAQFPMAQDEFNPPYAGPYKFKEGPVRFPTNEQILSGNGEEFSYFDYQYPQKYAEGGEVGEKMYFPPEYFNTAVPAMAGNTGIEQIQNAIRSPGGLYGLVNPAFNAQAEANQARWGQVQQYLRPAGSTGWGYGEIRAAHDKMMEAENPQAPSVNTQSPRFNPVGFNPGSPYLRFAEGGMTDGRYLKGPGDGMSDDIPATIDHENGEQQPARLAAGEFVVPADVVSHLGNGDSDSGAQKLYAMMDRIRRARTGKTDQAPEVDTDKMLPA